MQKKNESEKNNCECRSKLANTTGLMTHGGCVRTGGLKKRESSKTGGRGESRVTDAGTNNRRPNTSVAVSESLEKTSDRKTKVSNQL